MDIKRLKGAVQLAEMNLQAKPDDTDLQTLLAKAQAEFDAADALEPKDEAVVNEPSSHEVEIAELRAALAALKAEKAPKVEEPVKDAPKVEEEPEVKKKLKEEQ